MTKLDDIQNLLPKLRQPLHIDFICNNILKMSEYDALQILNDLVEQGIIEENNKTYQIKKLK